jgi:Cu2+-containing amine oxidase
MTPYSMGTIHEHIVNYKVDVDIEGRNNSLETVSVGTEAVYLPWLEQPHHQKILQRRIRQNEDEAKLVFNFHNITQWNIINSDTQNKWGTNKGVRISIFRSN